MQAQVPNHEPSLMLMNCGDSIQMRPSLGWWLLYGLGSDKQNLPGVIAMCPGCQPVKGAENWQSTILHLMGLDDERLTYRHSGRDFRLADVEGNVVKDILA